MWGRVGAGLLRIPMRTRWSRRPSPMARTPGPCSRGACPPRPKWSWVGRLREAPMPSRPRARAKLHEDRTPRACPTTIPPPTPRTTRTVTRTAARTATLTRTTTRATTRTTRTTTATTRTTTRTTRPRWTPGNRGWLGSPRRGTGKIFRPHRPTRVGVAPWLGSSCRMSRWSSSGPMP